MYIHVYVYTCVLIYHRSFQSSTRNKLLHSLQAQYNLYKYLGIVSSEHIYEITGDSKFWNALPNGSPTVSILEDNLISKNSPFAAYVTGSITGLLPSLSKKPLGASEFPEDQSIAGELRAGWGRGWQGQVPWLQFPEHALRFHFHCWESDEVFFSGKNAWQLPSDDNILPLTYLSNNKMLLLQTDLHSHQPLLPWEFQSLFFTYYSGLSWWHQLW